MANTGGENVRENVHTQPFERRLTHMYCKVCHVLHLARLQADLRRNYSTFCIVYSILSCLFPLY